MVRDLGWAVLEEEDECQLLLRDLLFVSLTLLHLVHAEIVALHYIKWDLKVIVNRDLSDRRDGLSCM